MRKPIKRILVTNDDGIDAPGIKIAQKIASALSDEIWVIAPMHEQSGASHSLTLTAPVRLIQRGVRRFAVAGTPTDCVMIATRHLMRDAPPSLVLSGVNFGFNIAEDVSYSGTVAGAKEGTVFGIPSIAMSQALRATTKMGTPRTIAQFGIAEKYAPDIIAALMCDGWPSDTLININFPAIAPDTPCQIRVTHQGKRDAGLLQIDARIDPRGRPYFWYDFNRHAMGVGKNSDIAAIYNGDISITPLKMDHTDATMKSKLSRLFKDKFENGCVMHRKHQSKSKKTSR